MVHIRWMVVSDFPRLLEIERTLYGDRAWKRKDFQYCQASKTTVGLIADLDPDSYHCIIGQGPRPSIVGYILYDFSRERMYDIINMAVDPAHHRKGIGSALLAKVAAKANPMGKMLSCTVRETNLPMLHFLKSRGFIARRLEKEMYDTGEDGILMHYQHHKKVKGKAHEQRSNTI